MKFFKIDIKENFKDFFTICHFNGVNMDTSEIMAILRSVEQ